jgi:hypothetical protein
LDWNAFIFGSPPDGEWVVRMIGPGSCAKGDTDQHPDQGS